MEQIHHIVTKKLFYLLFALLCFVGCEKDSEPLVYPPTLVTNEATNLTRFQATLSGSAIKNPKSVIDCEIEFLFSSSSSMSDPQIRPGQKESDSDRYTSTVDGLTPGSTYYYCICAVSGKTLTKGSVGKFTTTASVAPIPGTTAVSEATEIGFTLTSSITDDGGYAPTTRGFVYKEFIEGVGVPTTDDHVILVPTWSEDFTVTLTTLQPNTTYLIRSYAINQTGTGYGEPITVATDELKVPILTIGECSDIKAFSTNISATITDDRGLAITERGFCLSAENRKPTTENINVLVEGGNVSFSSVIDDLESQKKYYLRAYAINEKGTGYSPTIEFTTLTIQVASLSTPEINNVTISTAKVSSVVMIPEGTTVTEKGICYDKLSLTPTTDEAHIVSTDEGNAILADLKELEEGITYYVRAYAVTRDGTYYSSSVHFNTAQTYTPSLTAPAISTVKETSVQAVATVSDNGGAEVTTTGFCWSSSSQEPSLSDANSKYQAAGEGFKLDISELKGGTKYYIRAYAKNKNGVAYSTTTEFTTVQIYTPTVGMAVITNITKESVVAGATVKETGGTPIIEKGFCYGNSSQEPSIEKDTKVVSNAEGEAISATINGLEEGGKYYLRAYATNKKGTSYSSKIEFTTLTTYVPSLNNPTFTNISETGAAVSAQITDNGGTSITEKGICYSSSSTQPNISDDTKTTSSVEGNNIAVSLGSLTAGTKYYVRAYATNKRGTSYSATAELTTAQTFVPTLANVQVMDIKEVALSASSSVSNNGGAAVTEKGICYSSTSNQPTIDDTKILSTEAGNAITAKLTGLTGGVHYYLRAYAINKNGIGYGNVSDVVTISFDKPTVDMPTFSEINDDNAKATAIISNHGGPDMEITEKGFVWAVGNTSPTIEGDHSIKSTDNEDTFNAVLTGLSYRTTYWVRAYAKNRLGISYSGAKSFTSGYSSTPSIGSVTALNIQIATVDVSASITSDGGATVTEKGFVWATSSYPTIENNKLPVTTGGTDMTTTLTGLKAGTTYYIRAYAKNKNGYSYGYSTTVAMKQGDPDIDDNVPPINKKTNQK